MLDNSTYSVRGPNHKVDEGKGEYTAKVHHRVAEEYGQDGGSVPSYPRDLYHLRECSYEKERFERKDRKPI